EEVASDVALLKPGEIVSCDGVFFSGHNLLCNESGAASEFDTVRKLNYEGCMEIIK
ncbi:hypothetical protein DXG01_005491, partial [Tephrocybe rancida]